MIFSILLPFLALAPSDDLPGQRFSGRERQLEVAPPRTEAEIVVDGRLDEAVWRAAAVLTGFSQYAPVDGNAALDSTEVLVWYSPSAIHFGIRAFAEPGSVQATLADRDKIYSDDYIGIFLGTLGDDRQATVFALNPLGIQGDGIVVEGTASGTGFGGPQVGRDPTDISPDFVFQSKGRITEYGYEVEVRIPFKSLRYQNAERQRWKMNVLRRVQSRGTEDSWAPARRAAASYIAQFGSLTDLTELRRGLVLDINPVVTARADGGREGEDWRYRRSDPVLGGNVRWGITNNVTFNGTIRPDFAEVESDAGQIVADPRATLFLSEKRPFFLEGAEQFNTPGNLIYTRRIASPLAATKLSGKVGGATFGALTAVDDRLTSRTGRDRPRYDWLRIQRDFGPIARMGLVYTGKTDGDFTNTVGGADLRLVFGGIYSAQLQAAVSRTDVGLPGADALTAPMYRMTLARTGRRFGARYHLSTIHDDFRTASGYISRDSLARASASHSLTSYGGEGSLLERMSAEILVDGTWRYDAFVHSRDALEKKLHLNTNYDLRGGWRTGASVLVETFAFDAPLYADYAIERNEGATLDTVPFVGTPRIFNLDYVLTLTTPNFRRLSANAFYLWGRDENFFEWASADIGWMEFNVDWRPTSQLRVTQSYAENIYKRRTDGTLVGRTRLPRLRVEYQLTRAMFVRAVGEYTAFYVDSLRDDSRTNDPILIRDGAGVYQRTARTRVNQFRPELLFSYAPMPGTVFYLGYGGQLSDRRALRFNELERLRDQLFVKGSYLWRM